MCLPSWFEKYYNITWRPGKLSLRCIEYWDRHAITLNTTKVSTLYGTTVQKYGTTVVDIQSPVLIYFYRRSKPFTNYGRKEIDEQIKWIWCVVSIGFLLIKNPTKINSHFILEFTDLQTKFNLLNRVILTIIFFQWCHLRY